MPYLIHATDDALTARRISASIFGNEKIAEIVLLLESEPGALHAADIQRRTGFAHSLIRDVLERLGKTPALRALPRTGSARGPAYYEKCPDSPLWRALVGLAQAVLATDASTDKVQPDSP
jgi:hypothetical protein